MTDTFQQQQAAAATGGEKVLATTLWLKTGIQVAQNDRGANTHHHKDVSCRFETSSTFYGRFSVQKWPFSGSFEDIVLKTHDDRRCVKWGVCNEGHCSSIAIGLSIGMQMGAQ